MQYNPLQTWVIFIASGLVAGILGAFLYESVRTPSETELIRDFYAVETAAVVSPHGIRTHIAEGDSSFILVDLRSAQEYEAEHIAGAVNIPAYSDPDTSAYGDVERIVGAFEELKENNPDTDIIVYCYSMPCMTGRKIGHMLAEHGIYVQHLGVGWNEWRYHWELWNHPHEWSQTDVADYVASGAEPGEYTGEMSIEPCIDGEFGC